MKKNTITKSFFNPISLTVLIILLSVSVGLFLLELIGISILIPALLFSIFIATSINIADQW